MWRKAALSTAGPLSLDTVSAQCPVSSAAPSPIVSQAALSPTASLLRACPSFQVHWSMSPASIPVTKCSRLQGRRNYQTDPTLPPAGAAPTSRLVQMHMYKFAGHEVVKSLNLFGRRASSEDVVYGDLGRKKWMEVSQMCVTRSFCLLSVTRNPKGSCSVPE